MEFILGLATYRRPDLARNCIVSAFQGTLKPHLVYVIDNWGEFTTPPGVGRVIIIHPPSNRGFAGSVNLLHWLTLPHRLLICNDDITFGPTAIEKLFAHEDQGDCICGLGFGCFWMKQIVWDKVGQFDDNFYPVYFDDNDHSHRMIQAGIRICNVDIDVVHVEGGSCSLKCLTPAQQEAHNIAFRANAEYYKEKWGGYPGEEVYTVPFNGAAPPPLRDRGIR